MKSSCQVGLFLAAAMLGMGCLLSASAVLAATFDGGSGADVKWSTDANWAEDVPPVSGSPNLQVILDSSDNNGLLTSNEDLAAPFALQHLTIGRTSSFTPHIVEGLPLAFSNFGGAPSIRSFDSISSPYMTINNDLIFNADVTVLTPKIYVINGGISGVGGLRHQGTGSLTLGGTTANTYAGLTTLDDGLLYLQKPASVIAVPGDVVINSAPSTRSVRGTVFVLNDNQIAADATVTINQGLFSVNGGDQTLANLRFTGINSPSLNLDGGDVVISPSQILTITGGLTRTGVTDLDFVPSTSVISGGTLNLAAGQRLFHVDNVTPPGFTPTTLTVSSVIANGGIEKTGIGVLHLSEAKNTFTGNVLINGGMFSVGQKAELMFDLENGGVSNRILGTASANFDGIFRIDAASVTDISSSLADCQ